MFSKITAVTWNVSKILFCPPGDYETEKIPSPSNTSFDFVPWWRNKIPIVLKGVLVGVGTKKPPLSSARVKSPLVAATQPMATNAF